ncbi:hypothetical protein [Mycoplasmopsis verecunda]|nr:hypothetical protein [Mycoplasmopsis verecunda]WPB54855.1 hypothetical protein SAM46_01720 [Mycoplasmopsis verecunda]
MKLNEINIMNKFNNLNKLFIIQGSGALYIQNMLNRVPNDVDVLLDTYGSDIFEKNKRWNSLINKFDVIKHETKNEFFDSLLINNSYDDKYIFECMLFKNIPNNMIKTINDYKVIDAKYMIGFKICQLFSNLSEENTQQNKISKLRNCLLDLNYILDNISMLTIDEIFQIWKECIFVNIDYELLAYRLSPYNYLENIEFDELCQMLNIDKNTIPNSLYLLQNLKKYQSSSALLNTLQNIYRIKNEFIFMLEWFADKHNIDINTITNYGYYFNIGDSKTNLSALIFIYSKICKSNDYPFEFNSNIVDFLEVKNEITYINLFKIIKSLVQF